MKIFSMFSGIGGFELGFKSVYGNNLEIVGQSEIDKYANKIYDYHFSNVKNYGNAKEINPDDIPDFDILCGGFPCQSFSIAGKRGGIRYDTRGTLFKEIIRIAKAKRPRIILLENVRGLLSSQQGWDFYVILNSLVQLGYSIEWEVLNSKNFGVPQNRERIFIIGYLGEKSSRQIFPIGKNGQTVKKITTYAIDTGYGRGGGKRARTVVSQTRNQNNYVGTLQAGTKSGGLHSDMDTILMADYRDDEGLRIRKDNNTPCLNASKYRDHNTNKNLSQCPPLVINKTKIRRLTPLECERLQGFPDNWTKGISDTQRYKCLGNAVTVNVVKVIVEKIQLVYSKK